MIYNIRHDRTQTHDIARRAAEEQLLSQGWGGGRDGNLDLRDLRHDDFVERVMNHYKKHMRSTRIPTNLTRMALFKDGDLLVTPHLPEKDKVSLHIVDGDFPECYDYDYDYDTEDDTHQNHRIRLKQSVGLDGRISIRNERLHSWHAKLRSLQLPVLPIPDCEEIFRTIFDEMVDDPSREVTPSELDDFIDALAQGTEEFLTTKLRSMAPAGGSISFEKMCERLLEATGYEIEGRNQFDRKGGDVDLRCRRARGDTSPFEGGDVTLFVQIKKHKGATDEVAVRQVLKMMEAEPHADGCVMSVADDYTDSAKKLADGNAIVLLDKSAICSQLLSLLAGRSAGD